VAINDLNDPLGIPQKVLAFLDITGIWDPSLMFVMGGAIAVNVIFLKFILKRKTPYFAKNFSIPTKKSLDRNLIVGSLLFGIGWGMAGICPGPAIANVPTLSFEVFFFVGSMLLGMLLFHLVEKILIK